MPNMTQADQSADDAMRHAETAELSRASRQSSKSTDRQEIDLLAAGVRHDDLYIDRGVSGARASRPQFVRAMDALIQDDVLA